MAFLPAALDSFGFYREGVYYEKECSNYELDHQVLLYGYGTSEQGEPWVWVISEQGGFQRKGWVSEQGEFQGEGRALHQGKVSEHRAAPATGAAICLCSD